MNRTISWLALIITVLTAIAICIVSGRNQALQRRVTELEKSEASSYAYLLEWQKDLEQFQAQFYNMQLETERIRTNLATMATLTGTAILKQQRQLDCLNLQTAMLQAEIEHASATPPPPTNFLHPFTNYFYLPAPLTNGGNAPAKPQREQVPWSEKPYGGGVHSLQINYYVPATPR